MLKFSPRIDWTHASPFSKIPTHFRCKRGGGGEFRFLVDSIYMSVTFTYILAKIKFNQFDNSENVFNLIDWDALYL